MALRLILASTDCTVQDFEIAAEERFWEGLELLAAGKHGAGIYLLGYTAEMLLKNACFRLDPSTTPGTPIEGRLRPARDFMRFEMPELRDENYHSVRFWQHYLLLGRARFGIPPMLVELAIGLNTAVSDVYENWWVSMRYRPERATARDAEIVYDRVVWIRDHYLLLWR